jgi:hypothetical protein
MPATFRLSTIGRPQAGSELAIDAALRRARIDERPKAGDTRRGWPCWIFGVVSRIKANIHSSDGPFATRRVAPEAVGVSSNPHFVVLMKRNVHYGCWQHYRRRTNLAEKIWALSEFLDCILGRTLHVCIDAGYLAVMYDHPFPGVLFLKLDFLTFIGLNFSV